MTADSDRNPPHYVLWEITRACNLRCKHCLTSSGTAASDELTTQQALKVCDSLGDMGVGAVAIMGGEPLLRPDWEQFAARLTQRGVAVGLVTNGVLFDESTAQRARNVGVNQIVVSLDGGRGARSPGG